MAMAKEEPRLVEKKEDNMLVIELSYVHLLKKTINIFKEIYEATLEILSVFEGVVRRIS